MVLERDRKQQVLDDIEETWGRYWARINAIPRDALIGLTDPAGWTPCDHIDHVRAWEASITSLLNGSTHHDGLGVSREEYATLDFDGLNALVRERRAGLTLDEVLAAAEDGHQAFVAAVEALPEGGLWRSYGSFLPDSYGDHRSEPIVRWVRSVSVEHYPEHLGYIEVIVGQASRTAALTP